MSRGYSAFFIVASASLAACVSLDGLAEDDATQQQSQTTLPPRTRGTGGTPAPSGSGTPGGGAPSTEGAPGSPAPAACASITAKTKDSFDRQAPVGDGWIPGAYGTNGMDIYEADSAPSASNVLLARFQPRAAAGAWVQPTLQREVPATTCLAADFAIYFGQDGPLDVKASTELFYVAGADNAYVTLYRRESGAMLAGGVLDTDKLFTQADFPRETWVHVHLEVELAKDDGTASISFDGGEVRRLVGIPKLKPPIWVGIGGYSQGRVPEHYTAYDDVTLSY